METPAERKARLVQEMTQRPGTDARVRLDPGKQETSTERKKRIRSEFGLRDDDSEEPRYEPSGLMVGQIHELVGSEKTAAILGSDITSPNDLYTKLELAENTTIEELRKRLGQKGVDVSPASDLFFSMAQQTLAEMREDADRSARKTEKADSVGPGTIVSPSGQTLSVNVDAAVEELSAIQSGRKGSVTSVANQKRRAELSRIIREFGK